MAPSTSGSKGKPIPINELRAGDIFYDHDTGEWLRADTGALQTHITFLDEPTGRYEWTADGHRYNAPLHDKHGDVLHILVMR